MSGITVTIQAESLQQLYRDVAELHGAVAGDDIRKVMGFAIKETVQRHFVELAQDEQHHQTAASLGAERTGFYEKAREGTHDPQLESGGVSVSIDQKGIRQRLFGGTISARPGSYLTIPAQAIAYGHRAREFDLRFIIFGQSGVAALVERNTPEASEADVVYWLVRSVTQQPDPTVLPTEQEMLEAAKKNALAYIEQIWGRN